MDKKNRRTTLTTPLYYLAILLLTLTGCSSEPEKTPQELIIGKWEYTKESIDKVNELRSDEWDVAGISKEYYKNGEALSIKEYLNPSDSQNGRPTSHQFNYAFVLNNEIKESSDGIVEYIKVIKLTKDKYVFTVVKANRGENIETIDFPEITLSRID